VTTVPADAMRSTENAAVILHDNSMSVSMSNDDTILNRATNDGD